MDIFRSPRDEQSVIAVWDRLNIFIEQLSFFYGKAVTPDYLEHAERRLISVFNQFNEDFDRKAIDAIDWELVEFDKLVPAHLRQNKDYLAVLEFFQECKDFLKDYPLEFEACAKAHRELQYYFMDALLYMADPYNKIDFKESSLEYKRVMIEQKSVLHKHVLAILFGGKPYSQTIRAMHEVSKYCYLILSDVHPKAEEVNAKTNNAIYDYEALLITKGLL